MLFLTTSTASWAKATPIEEGEPAPYSGQLLDPETAIKLSQKAGNCDIRLNLELERMKAIHEAQLEAVRPKWFEHPAFVATMTVLGVVSIVGVTAFGLQAASQ